ncbi:MAG TPA: AAA family ATPase [Candidatus Avidesulfovibrio excrementigallinarum]|nr:AAA family ATPase [Candidatus Avidesulfovibrio excrementigallinarum]
MRIRDAHIEQFGLLRDARMSELPDGLTVVLGRNEAGKSTLLDFFRATLTGYPVRPQGRDAAYLQRGRASGSLTLDTPQGLVRLTRRSGPGGGTLALCDADGQPLEAGVWQTLLGGVTREIYSRIYGFGLGELQNLATLNDSQIRNALYGAGFGVGLHSPGEALKKLTDMMGALFKPSGSRQPVAQALRNWEELGQQIRDARVRLEAYDRMAVAQEELRQACKQRNAELAALEQERRRIERRLSVWQRWDEWRVLGVRLERMPAVPETVPSDAPARLRELCARTEAAQRQADRERARCEQLQAKLDALHPEERLAGELDALRSLGELRGACRNALREVATLSGELTRAGVALESELSALGPGWTADTVRQRRPGVEASERLARLASSMLSAEKARDVAHSEEKLAARELALATEAMREVQARAASLAREPLPHRDALETKLSALRELRGLLLLYPVEESRFGEQRERLEVHMARRPDTAAGPVLLGSGALLLLAGAGVATVTAGLGWPGLTLPSGQIVPLELWQGGAGLLGGAVLLALGLSGHRQRTQRHDETAATLRTRAEETLHKLEALRGRTMELAETLGLEEPDTTRVDALETALNREKERGIEMERRWQAVKTLHEERDRRLARAREAAQQAAAACDRADEECQARTGAWRQALTALGFAPSLSPSTVREALQHVGQAIRQTENIARIKEALAAGQATIAAFWEPLRAVEERLGRAPCASPETAVASFEPLLKEATLAMAACEERDRLREQLARQTQEFYAASAVSTEAQGELSSLLRLAETDDPEEFLRRAAIRAETIELAGRREALRAELWIAGSDAARLERPGAPFAEEDFAAYLDGFLSVDRDSLETRLQQTVENLALLGEARQRDEETLREQEYALRQLSASDELAVLHGHQEAASDQLRRHAFDWARLALARHMLEKAKERFERERQPEVIRMASRLLGIMTDGAWNTVSMALDGGSLTVLPPVGEGVTPELLSRGTQEQLYLALRLAHVRQQARLGGVFLPLIMDDILVNFDPERAKRTAGVLEEMVTPSDGGQGHQTLFFTCHPHIASLLLERMPRAALFVMEHGALRRDA